MSSIFQGLAVDGKLPVNAVDPIDHYSRGLPFTADGAVAVEVGAVVRYSQGIPFTASNRVAFAGDPVDNYGPGATPYTLDGSLAGSQDGTTHVTQGVPYAANGAYSVEGLGYQDLSWQTIPAQAFQTGIPKQVDFRDYLRGTNRATATITEVQNLGVGFSWNDGVLTWDGTGTANTIEEQLIASDGIGPDADSNLFNIQVTAFEALNWDTIPDVEFTYGTPGSFPVRPYLNGTNAATAVLTCSTLPTGYTFNGEAILYSGVGNPAAFPGINADDGTTNVESNQFNVTTDYVPLSWSGPVIWEPPQNGSPSQLDIRAELSGTNAATAQIGGLIASQMPSPQILPAGYSWDGSILTYDGVSSQDLDSGLTASDGVGPDANTPITVTPVLDVSLVSASWTINNKDGTLDSRDPDYAGPLPGQISVASSVTFSDGGQVQIAVTRSGGADGIVGASWQITGPNAADFSPNNGTVSFADGETIGNITTTIADIVGGGSATLTLSSPTGGATLGNASLAITVSDASYGFTPEAGFSLAAGTIGDDEVITITDAQNRFGTKPNGGPPLHLWDAEYGDTDWSSLARNTQSHTDPIATLQTSVLPPNAVRAFQYNLRYNGSLSFIFGKLVWGNSPIINVAMRFRSNFRGSDYTFANAKGFRNPTNDGSSSSVPNWTGPDLGAATSGFSTGTIYHGESDFGMAQFDNTWRTLHFFGRLSSSSLERVEVDGVREDYPGTIGNRSGAYFQDTNMLTEQAGDDWTPKISGSAWWASYIYGDDSHCVAYLTDQANYSTTAEQERALCIPVSWVNGELQVRLRKRTYSDLTGLYLFAQTNDYTILKLGRIT